jgi:hypothetical protein
MAFDINPQGTISLTPLVMYEAAVIADAGIGMRLILATPEDRLGTGSLIVQTAMSAEQADELAQDLLKIVERIRNVRQSSSTH